MTDFITTSEKDTDRDMSVFYKSVFGYNYSTGTSKELFGNNKPDGYDVILTSCKKTIVIIENKDRKTKFMRAKKQILDKYITDSVITSCEDIYCIIGTGNNETFEYVIYKYSLGGLTTTGLTMEELHCEVLGDDNDEYLKNVNPHSINEYIYQNINIPKTDRTLFISFILIVLKIDYQFLEHYKDVPGEIIIDKMFSAIDNQYKDSVFIKKFEFIRSESYRDHVPQIMKMLSIYMSNNRNSNLDILNQFYSEFTVYDKNGEGSLGIVLTPDDIVELMVKELDIKPADYVLDTCTGTGSFLVKSSQYTKHLVGCENNSERYTLAKCNFILHNMDYKHLFYDSCFNVEFPVCDKLIINPPFGCNCGDEKSSRNDTSWKSFTNEQKFVLYSIQFIRDGGMGAVIIPCNNFNNNTKAQLSFKTEFLKHITPMKIFKCNSAVFTPNANVQCSILIFVKARSISPVLLQVDYSNDGYKIEKKKRVKKSDPEINTVENVVDEKSNWNYSSLCSEHKIDLQLVLKYNISYIYSLYDSMIVSSMTTLPIMDPNTYPIAFEDIKYEYKQCRLLDYFDNISIKTNMKIDINKTTPGIIPLISRSNENNSVVKYINEITIDTGEYITIGCIGNVAYHKAPFSITSNVKLLKPKSANKYSLHIWVLVIRHRFNTEYSFTNNLTTNKLEATVVNMII